MRKVCFWAENRIYDFGTIFVSYKYVLKFNGGVMKLRNKTSKWQLSLLNKALPEAESFIINKYKVPKGIFESLTLQVSNTCRFPKITWDDFNVRIDAKRTAKVILYRKKSLGKYKSNFSVDGVTAYASQLVHELTHFVIEVQGRKQGEVETTKNEIDYLESKGYKVKL